MKVGDYVQVVKKFTGFPEWTEHMDATIGKIYKISAVRPAVGCNPKHYELDTFETTKKQNYNYLESSLKVVTIDSFLPGTVVKVGRKVADPAWVPVMDAAVGKEYKVTDRQASGYQCVTLSSYVDLGANYSFPIHSLEFVLTKNAFGKDVVPVVITATHVEPFKKGDRVRVVKKHESAAAMWVSEMNCTIGKEFSILADSVSPGRISVYSLNTKEYVESFGFAQAINFWYTPESLELVPPKTEVNVDCNAIARNAGCDPSIVPVLEKIRDGVVASVEQAAKQTKQKTEPKFKIGDLVKITRPPSKETLDEFSSAWLQTMDKSIGINQFVKSVWPCNGIFFYKLTLGQSQSFDYAEECLELIKEAERVFAKGIIPDPIKIDPIKIDPIACPIKIDPIACPIKIDPIACPIKIDPIACPITDPVGGCEIQTAKKRLWSLFYPLILWASGVCSVLIVDTYYAAPSVEELTQAVEEFPELKSAVREALIDGHYSREERQQITERLERLRLKKIKNIIVD